MAIIDVGAGLSLETHTTVSLSEQQVDVCVESLSCSEYISQFAKPCHVIFRIKGNANISVPHMHVNDIPLILILPFPNGSHPHTNTKPTSPTATNPS